MKIATVCKYGVFRSQVLAAFLRKYEIKAEAYGLLNKYEGKIVEEINKEIFYRLEKEFDISFCKNKVKVLTKEIIEKSTLVIAMDANIKREIVKKFDNKEKVFSLKDLIGMEVEDLKGKSYEEHRKFVKLIDKNVKKIIEEIEKLEKYGPAGI